MRRYTADEESRIRTAAKIRDWVNSGLLTADQGKRLAADLETDLKTTNRVFRAMLFIFGTIIVWAMAGLAFLSMSVTGETGAALVALVLGGGYLFAADVLVAQSRLYRYGIEEAFAAWSAGFLSFGISFMAMNAVENDNVAITLGLFAGAAIGFGIYRRFGYVYAAVAAGGCAALIPYFTELPAVAQRLTCALILVAIILVTRAVLQRNDDGEFPGDDYSLIEAAAWIGLYLCVNLVLFAGYSVTMSAATPPAFVWLTYLAIWLLPPLVLYLGVSARRRVLLRVGLGMALATLATNKMYLGLPHQTWDPILLGLLLAGAAAFTRRWLALGISGQRDGFTADRLLASQTQVVDSLGTVVGAAQLAIDHAHPTPIASRPPAETFEPGHGGRSGGAGAGGSF